MRILTLFPILIAAACGGQAATAPPVAPAKPESADSDKPATLEEARAFLEKIDKDLRRLWTARDRAGWVSQNFITDDTEVLAAQAEEATAEYVGKAILASRRFKDLKLPDDLARQMYLLRLAQTVPTPTDANERKELTEIEAWMTAAYGKGKYCPKRLNGNCLTLDELSKTLRTSKKYDDLLDAWTGWHSVSPPIRE